MQQSTVLCNTHNAQMLQQNTKLHNKIQSHAIAGRTVQLYRCKFQNISVDKLIMERLCTLNTAILSTQMHLALKPAQNTLNHA